MDITRENDVTVASCGFSDRQRHPGVTVTSSVCPPGSAGVEESTIRDPDLFRRRVSLGYTAFVQGGNASEGEDGLRISCEV